MKELNWGEELCGHEVTPEGWIGGITERWSGWVIAKRLCHKQIDESGRPGIDGCHLSGHKPFFPPRGWAGKTDAALFAELTGGTNVIDIGPIRFLLVGTKYTWCLFDLNRRSPEYEHNGMLDPAEIPDYVQALQNAQVLARRLRE